MRLGTEQAGLGRSERFWTQKNSHKMFQDWMWLTTCCAQPATGTRLRCRLVPLHAPDARWKSRLAVRTDRSKKNVHLWVRSQGQLGSKSSKRNAEYRITQSGPAQRGFEPMAAQVRQLRHSALS